MMPDRRLSVRTFAVVLVCTTALAAGIFAFPTAWTSASSIAAAVHGYFVPPSKIESAGKNSTATAPTAVLLSWNTGGNAGTETTEPSISNDPNISPSSLTIGAGVTPVANGGRFGGTAWFDTGDTTPQTTLADSVAGNDYLEFIVQPNAGFVVSYSSFAFRWARSGTGPTAVTLRSSVDNFSTDLGSIAGITTAGFVENTITIAGLNDIAGPATFRIYGYGGTDPVGTGGFDTANGDVPNVVLNGTVTSAPPTNPTGVGLATPSSVVPNDPNTLTVTVSPGTNPTSTGLAVTADLSSIGGSATQAFFDDGTNGDTTIGDNIFAFATIVGISATPGSKSIPFTVADAQVRNSGGNISLTVNEPVTQTKALWVFGGSLTPNSVSNATGRANLVERSTAAGITELYVSVYQGTPDPISLRLMYADADMAALISAAHAAGQKVWAAYGAPDWPTFGCTPSDFPVARMAEVAAYNASRPANERFDGVMLDVEPAPATEADFQALIAHYECMRASLPPEVLLGAAISAFWDDDTVEYPLGSMSDKPASNHIIDLDLDRVVVMGYRDLAGTDTCPSSNGIICLDKAEIDYATSINKSGLVLAGMETLNPAAEVLSDAETFFEEGQIAMNAESANVSSYFGTSSGFGGFAIHNYGASFLSGAAGWPFAPSAASASVSGRITDSKGRGIRGAVVTVTGMDGVSRNAYTNTLGYYRVEGLQVGEGFMIAASARRYRFAAPVQFVDLSDSIADLNFTASP